MSRALAVALPLAILAGSAGLSFLAAASQVPAPVPAPPSSRYFDPLLSDAAALCTSSGARRKLLGYYQKLAAVTETRPFSPPAIGGAPPQTRASRRFTTISVRSPSRSRPIAPLPSVTSIRDCGWRSGSITRRRGEPSARRRSTIRTARCAIGARRFVLGPNINAPMDKEAVAPAIAALRMAGQRAAAASERERALIVALGRPLLGGSQCRAIGAERALCRRDEGHRRALFPG